MTTHTGTTDDGPSELARGQLVPRAHLFVLLESERPHARGARYALDDIETVVVQRGEARRAHRAIVDGRRTLVVELPGRSLSGTHARFVLDGTTWRAEDAGSRNGTFVDGERVTSARLGERSVVEMGRTFLAIRTACPTPLDAPADTTDSDTAARPLGTRTLLPWLAQKHATLARIAPTTIPVMLLGATGTGKELLARAVHASSGRRGPLVAVNCGALPSNLVEALLFGHARGAFSGAVREELGFLRSAEGGTLFLDEIGDLPMPSQTALLRVLQESEVTPVGSTRTVKIDVRVVAATHQPIASLVAAGAFREDLLARLKGFVHTLPSLDARREDIGILVGDLLEPLSSAAGIRYSLSREAARLLVSHPYPMNVRELAQYLAAAAALATGDTLETEHFPDTLRDEVTAAASAVSGLASSPNGHLPSDGSAPTGAALEERLVGHLESTSGNVAAVARAMGKKPFQIHRWLKRFSLDPSRYRK